MFNFNVLSSVIQHSKRQSEYSRYSRENNFIHNHTGQICRLVYIIISLICNIFQKNLLVSKLYFIAWTQKHTFQTVGARGLLSDETVFNRTLQALVFPQRLRRALSIFEMINIHLFVFCQVSLKWWNQEDNVKNTPPPETKQEHPPYQLLWNKSFMTQICFI